MGPDPSSVVASVAKSLEVDRSPNASQRASEVSQDQLAGESVAAMGRKRADAADQARRDKIRRDRERRRRELERHAPGQEPESEADDSTGLDVVV